MVSLRLVISLNIMVNQMHCLSTSTDMITNRHYIKVHLPHIRDLEETVVPLLVLLTIHSPHALLFRLTLVQATFTTQMLLRLP